MSLSVPDDKSLVPAAMNRMAQVSRRNGMPASLEHFPIGFGSARFGQVAVDSHRALHCRSNARGFTRPQQDLAEYLWSHRHNRPVAGLGDGRYSGALGKGELLPRHPEELWRIQTLPPSLAMVAAAAGTQGQRGNRRCLEAMDRALPLQAVWLFGSHARGDARPDSDVDLCLVAEGAEQQVETAQRFRRAIWDIRGKPSMTLVPIAPRRLEEKQASGDFSFCTILSEGVPLATTD